MTPGLDENEQTLHDTYQFIPYHRIDDNNCSHEAPLNLNESFIFNLTNLTLQVYPWVFLIVGTITNTLSFVVFMHPQLKKSSTFFYLSFLSIVDMLSLQTFCINFILLYQFDIDIQAVSLILCKLYSFLIYFLPQLSAWICAAVSLDRVICVLIGMRAKTFNTPRFGAKVLFTIFLLLLLLNFHFFYYDQELDPTVRNLSLILDINLIYCSPEHSNEFQGWYQSWVKIDLFVNVLIPFSIMIASSVVIIVKVYKSTSNMNQMRRIGNTPSENSGTVRKMLKKKHRSPSLAVNQNSELLGGNSSGNYEISVVVSKRKTSLASTFAGMIMPKKSNKTKAKSVSKMLVFNNLVFIFLTLPIVVFLSMSPNLLSDEVCMRKKVQLRFFKVMFIILMNINYVINIFIYSSMSSEFRRQLNALQKRVLTKLGIKK